MRKFALIAAAVFASVSFSLATAPEQIQQAIGKLVSESIRLLKAKDYVTFLEMVALPEELETITAEKDLDAFAVDFATKKAALMLAILQTIEGKKPDIAEDGNSAAYRLPEIRDVPKRDLVFIRIKDRWYIKN